MIRLTSIEPCDFSSPSETANTDKTARAARFRTRVAVGPAGDTYLIREKNLSGSFVSFSEIDQRKVDQFWPLYPTTNGLGVVDPPESVA